MNKRNSYNHKQSEYINRLTEQLLGKQEQSTAVMTTDVHHSEAAASRKSSTNFTNDVQIQKILKNKQKVM